MKNIKRIVLTGGPCAGKTSALKILKEYFENKGYSVFVEKEPATALISSGINLENIKDYNDFQRAVLSVHLFQEYLLTDYLENKLITNENVLILYDRGIFDMKAYMPDDVFEMILNERGLSKQTLLNKYDAVFHLVTTANGAQAFYGKENNSARMEDLDLAKKLDEKTAGCWKSYKNFKIIDNSTDFDGKMKRLIQAIEDVLNK